MINTLSLLMMARVRFVVATRTFAIMLFTPTPSAWITAFFFSRFLSVQALQALQTMMSCYIHSSCTCKSLVRFPWGSEDCKISFFERCLLLALAVFSTCSSCSLVCCAAAGFLPCHWRAFQYVFWFETEKTALLGIWRRSIASATTTVVTTNYFVRSQWA